MRDWISEKAKNGGKEKDPSNSSQAWIKLKYWHIKQSGLQHTALIFYILSEVATHIYHISLSF